mgnify:CR=1 FL=1
MKKPLIVIGGPTACGKTGFSIRLAKEIGGEVISADSMQIYRYMDIGTAKVTPEEADGVPHYLIDELNPDEEYNVMLFQQKAKAYMEEIWAKGRIPILVGGTGLYIDSLIAGRQFAPLPQTGRREALERRAAEEGAQPLLDELRAVDPERAVRLSVSDVKRIVRALEIWQETGRTMTDFDRESRAIPPRYRPLWLGLHFPERAQLYARIDLRVELMYAQGLAQEVRALLDSGVPDRATSLQAIGYKQVVQALEEGLPPEAALGTIQQATRRYAKRQMTWFRANPAVQWLDASAGADEIFRAALQKAADFDSGI